MREWLAIAAKNLDNQDEDDELDDDKDGDFEAPLWSEVMQESWAGQSIDQQLKGMSDNLGSPEKRTPKQKRKLDDDEYDLKHMPWKQHSPSPKKPAFPAAAASSTALVAVQA